MKTNGFLSVLLVLCLLLMAAVPALAEDGDDLFVKITNANTLDSLLERHRNVTVISIVGNDDYSYNETSYADQDKIVTTDESGYVTVVDAQNEWGCYTGEEDEICPFIYFFASDEEYQEYLEDCRLYFCLLDLDEGELLEPVIENGEMTVTVCQSMEYLSSLNSFDEETLGSWEDVVSEDFVFVLDAETYEAKGYSIMEVHSDGSKTILARHTIAYDGPAFHVDEALYARTHAADRTCTLILDPETDQEQTLSIMTGNGVVIYPFLPVTYEGFFSDPECTEYIEELPIEGDFTIYSRGIVADEME